MLFSMNFRPKNVLLTLAVGAASFLIGTGCERDDVKVYHVETNDVATAPSAAPTMAPAAAPSSGIMPATMPAGLPTPDNSGLPRLKYTVPTGWTEKAPSQMRVASFSVSDSGKNVDISVVPLSGMGGGDFANVNRWRGQIGLAPLDAASLPASRKTLNTKVGPVSLFDFTSEGDQKTRLVAGLASVNGSSWFFKMTGDATAVGSALPAFTQLITSLRPATP